MMSVIGFDKIVEKATAVAANFGVLVAKAAAVKDPKGDLIALHYINLEILRAASTTSVKLKSWGIDGSIDNRALMSTRAGIAIWGLGLERCPPCMSYALGAIEFGASLALMTDIRNQIIASVAYGTAAEKERKTSSFYTAYVRRSAQSGVAICPPLLMEVFQFISAIALPGLQLKSDMPEELKGLANDIIKERVAAMSVLSNHLEHSKKMKPISVMVSKMILLNH